MRKPSDITSIQRSEKDDSPSGKSAEDLFPDLIKEDQEEKACILSPPPPPDIDGLLKGIRLAGPNNYADLQAALVFFVSKYRRKMAERILKEMGYRVDTVLSGAHATQKLKEYNYNVVIYEAKAVKDDAHGYICKLPSARRRSIFYVLVGPHLHTLYDLEALSLSANLVINIKELKHLKKILEKGFRDYDNLFGPFLEILNSNSSLF